MAPAVEQFHAWLRTHIPTLDTYIRFYEWETHAPDSVFLLLTGEPRTGKTTLIEAWAEQYHLPAPPTSLVRWYDDEPAEPKQAHAAILFSGINHETPTQCARRFLQEHGQYPSARTAQNLWQEIADLLSSAQIRLLIIDQAERLSLSICQYLQDYIYERTACSLLLVGTPDVLPTLARDASLYQRIHSCTITQLTTPP
jgi:hypothetical protein